MIPHCNYCGLNSPNVAKCSMIYCPYRKPSLARWFIPLNTKQPCYFKHPDGKYYPAPPNYIFESDRGGWTHPAFATPTGASQ
jgi:hypothetical protein